MGSLNSFKHADSPCGYLHTASLRDVRPQMHAHVCQLRCKEAMQSGSSSESTTCCLAMHQAGALTYLLQARYNVHNQVRPKTCCLQNGCGLPAPRHQRPDLESNHSSVASRALSNFVTKPAQHMQSEPSRRPEPFEQRHMVPAGAYCGACSPPPTAESPCTSAPPFVWPHCTQSLYNVDAHAEAGPVPLLPTLMGCTRLPILRTFQRHLSSGLQAPSVDTQQTHMHHGSAAPCCRRSLLPNALDRAGEEVLHVVHDGAAQLLLRRDHGNILG